MKTKKLHQIAFTLITLFLLSANLYSQVGIGTLNPDPSAMLDLDSTTKGMLAPRMTSTERISISNPANGLLVYDTSENAFYFYKSSTWTKLDSKTRNNHKLIKSEADLSDELTAGGGSKYLLSSNSVYEINGIINLTFPIELNNAYLKGLHTNEDKLIKASGDMFIGSKGGTIKNLTLAGGTIFNLTGSTSESLIIRDSVIANAASVGVIDGYGIVFLSIVQFTGNASGIEYSDINNLLISNTGWFSTNSGVYETYSGTFSSIEKQGGFMTINGEAKGIDLSNNPSVSKAVLSGVSFNGTSTEYVKKYSTGTYPDYSFNNSWTVDCPGIKVETDQVASANIYYNGTITTGFVQTVTNGNAFNLTGNSGSNTTNDVNMFRSSSPQNNRITYLGNKTRTFKISASLSVRGNSGIGDYYAFFIRKNGSTSLIETNTLMRVNNTSDISSNAISGTVELGKNDYIEIWAQRLTGSGTTSITVFSLNLDIK
ncbi:hypothetical protein [Psychroserpens mesophilus]|uniref:hypothetical protein n=1 Tax=Psychroserpens mesophilus TaxID=325473 RepID=UPI003D65FD02